MSRRADPARIAVARREAQRLRLIRNDRIREADVDAWLIAAASEGLSGELAHEWIVLQVGLGRRPPAPGARRRPDEAGA